MNICTDDDEGLDETEDDTGLLRIGNLICAAVKSGYGDGF